MDGQRAAADDHHGAVAAPSCSTLCHDARPQCAKAYSTIIRGLALIAMSTIREVLLSLDGEDATSIQPIIAFLEALGFNADGQAGAAFCLLTADQAPGLNVRQQLALKAAIQGACHPCACRDSSRLQSYAVGLPRECGRSGGHHRCVSWKDQKAFLGVSSTVFIVPQCGNTFGCVARCFFCWVCNLAADGMPRCVCLRVCDHSVAFPDALVM